jgi:hypothetical protein
MGTLGDDVRKALDDPMEIAELENALHEPGERVDASQQLLFLMARQYRGVSTALIRIADFLDDLTTDADDDD